MTTEAKPAAPTNIPKPPKPKTTGDYLDVEGRPFVIKKIMTGGRLLLKEMPNWPESEPDWHQVENLNRKGRLKLAKEIREEMASPRGGDTSIELSDELLETVFLPLLEGKALEMEGDNRD